MKVYIDIDGVLLTRSLNIPEYGEEFIVFLTEHYECYWLTTHCRNGENKAINYLKQYYNEDIVQRLSLIKPVNWDLKKTEGIDFHSDFIWLDDYPFEAEKLDLEKNDCLNRLIVVDLSNKKELEKLKIKLERISLMKGS